MDDDHEQLVEELEAVEAIYPDLLSKKQEDGSIIVVKVPQHEYMTLQISFPTHYPPRRLLMSSKLVSALLWLSATSTIPSTFSICSRK